MTQSASSEVPEVVQQPGSDSVHSGAVSGIVRGDGALALTGAASEDTPRPPFKVAGMATIKHLNVRKEGPEDEKILAVDVKLEIKNVDRRLCGYFDDALEAFLWRGDSDALIARNAFLSPVSYGNEISSAHVKIGGESYVGCDVRKFAMEACDGGVMTLTCSVALYPSSSDVSELAKLVQEDASVSIEGPPDLFAAVAATTAAANLDETMRRDGLTATLRAEGGEVLMTFGAADDSYLKAVELVRSNRKASISMVQRHLKIGYNRAAALIEEMERNGVVTEPNRDGVRKVVPPGSSAGAQKPDEKNSAPGAQS